MVYILMAVFWFFFISIPIVYVLKECWSSDHPVLWFFIVLFTSWIGLGLFMIYQAVLAGIKTEHRPIQRHDHHHL